MSSRSIAGAAAMALALACGHATAPPPASAPAEGLDSTAAPVSEAEPRTLAEAEKALERANLELLAAAPSSPPPAGAPAAAAPSVETQAARGPEDHDEALRQEERAPKSEEKRADSASPCEAACRAFSSLVRAKDAVCRLEVPRGPRCERAEEMVRDAEGRLQTCACPR
ncbi:MAG TPA: hypothetical protein VIM73_00480 [Polyangiaceae bacterium]